MIKLNETLYIGEGSHRAVYRHPDDPSRCLKIVKEGSLEQRRRRNKKWYKRLRKLSAFDETHKDLQAYKKLGNNIEMLKHIPRFFGMVPTSMGSGMLLELISNQDGSPAKTLAKHLQQGTNRIQIQKALQDLAENLISNSIAVRDFSIHDVMVSESEDGTLKLFIVDGLGGSEFIPFSKFPPLARKKAARRVNRFFCKITTNFPELTLPAQDS